MRIPYQQKRMFGFVTFDFPETVKLILAKGNPHFVCDARVLVKPYKEKGKIPDKHRLYLFFSSLRDFKILEFFLIRPWLTLLAGNSSNRWKEGNSLDVVAPLG